MIFRSASFALALLLVAPPAGAQDESSAATAADIAGHWSFSTGPYHTICSMTGEVTLEPTSNPNVFEGELVAYEACAGAERFEARQTAVAVRDGAGLTITSTLVSVEPPSDLYLADNFELRIMNSAFMVGELRSGNTVAKAQFRRTDGPIA